MEVVTTIADLKLVVETHKNRGESIGLVPTMGALHEGHLSLGRKARLETDFVVVSIFVNPTQFNNKEDLKKYPRTFENDIQLLSTIPCDLVFAPSNEEVYPEEDTRVFNFGSIGDVMEGRHRPGHFNGVAQVVSRLFDMVMPDKAFFGLKDFQQLAIIKSMTEQLKLDVEIVPCAIIREDDGLAMSSRNMLLEPEERKNAALISKTLFKAVDRARNYSINEVKNWVIETINSNQYLKVEYFDIVDDTTLKTIDTWDRKLNKIACVAVHCGRVRLIDNITF